jgi:hypothetical protein
LTYIAHKRSTTCEPKDITAQYFATFVVTKTGVTRITPAPTFYVGSGSEIIKSQVKIQDQELASTLARSLKPKKAKKATNGAPAS